MDEESECCEDEGETLELLEVPDPEQETEGPSASTEPLDANHRKAGMFKHFGYELC